MNYTTDLSDILGGHERIKLRASLTLVGRFFRAGVTRERIRQIEASEKLSEAVARDYRAALAKLAEEKRRATVGF
jgi:DNA-directed RNA polymerase sigma subunit (sigma70/sigma32)